MNSKYYKNGVIASLICEPEKKNRNRSPGPSGAHDESSSPGLQDAPRRDPPCHNTLFRAAPFSCAENIERMENLEKAKRRLQALEQQRHALKQMMDCTEANEHFLAVPELEEEPHHKEEVQQPAAFVRSTQRLEEEPEAAPPLEAQQQYNKYVQQYNLQPSKPYHLPAPQKRTGYSPYAGYKTPADAGHHHKDSQPHVVQHLQQTGYTPMQQQLHLRQLQQQQQMQHYCAIQPVHSLLQAPLRTGG